MSDGAHPITDEFMQGMLAASRTYTLVVLTPGPNHDSADAQAITWEHGRRNFELRAAGTLAIVGPVRDESDLAGIGIFTTGLAETEALLAQDPAIAAGVLTASVHPLTSFPGDQLPTDGPPRDGLRTDAQPTDEQPDDGQSGHGLPVDTQPDDEQPGDGLPDKLSGGQLSDQQPDAQPDAQPGDRLATGGLPGEPTENGAPA